MIFDAVKTDTVFAVEAKNLSQTRVVPGIGLLKYESDYSILINEKLHKIEIIDKNKLDEIDFYLKTRDNTAIVNITESIRDTFFTMEIIFFTYPLKEIYAPFYISLDEKIVETAKKRKLIKNKDGIKELVKVLKEKISFQINCDNYFLISTANASQDEVFDFKNEIKPEEEKLLKQKIYFEKTDEITDDEREENLQQIKEKIQNLHSEESHKRFNNEKKNLAFSIHGENIHLPVKKDIVEGGDYRFTATKLVLFNNSIQKDSLRLIKGSIEFKNGLMSERIAKDLGDIVESDDSYLKKWDEYTELEGSILLKKAKDVGELKLLNVNLVNGGYELKFENLSDALDENDYITFTDGIPSYISDDISWLEHVAQWEQQENLGKKLSVDKSFKVTKIEHGFVTLKTDENISKLKDKKVVLSIYGDEIQLRRKLEARKRLLTGKSANPLLGLIVEDTDNIKNYQKNKKTKKLEPLTPYVKDKIFSNPPTPNQIEAIDIVLNTPDIAIVQGPPGTGKTTILTAIIERLNEESDKSENMKGQILVAGFQHDAVENIISRLDINGIPTPKFGKKSTTLVDMNSFDRVISWSEIISSSVKNNLPELSNHLKIKKLQQYFEVYLKTPSIRFAIKLLKYIVNDLFAYLDDGTKEKAESLLDTLTTTKMDAEKELKYIYALRTTKDAFLDDGLERNQELLVSRVGQSLNEEEKFILQYADGKSLESDLKKLQKLKSTLIDRLYPRPVFRAEKPNEEILALKDDVEKQLSMGRTTKDKINSILADYVNELENNPFALKSMIEEYSYVFSATTGQSMGTDIKKAKKISKEDNVVFDTVIIDEAARVAPMDLLIALVQAKRRIVLVGDHRQLPHMVDETVIKDSALKEDNFIKNSMFGYLKNRAKKLEEYDGIKREITLENQYRTHPLLGKFISDNFYTQYNEGFDSPLGTTIGTPEDFFYQNLKGIENTPAIWMDVKHNPLSKQPRSRVCEAKEIMSKLRLWIDSEEGKKLDFGIITFYRDQMNMLQEELEKEFTKEERDGFKDRLKIGTVDSFQGMEFDIVFLSVVKSRDIKTITDDMEDWRLFGFITSKNRLCVSMSRQKKSLIVVGDKEFFDSQRAKEDVGELHNFLQLCKEKGKVI